MKGRVRYYILEGENKIWINFNGHNRLDAKIKFGDQFRVPSSNETYTPNDIFAQPDEEGLAGAFVLCFLGMIIHPLSIPFLFGIGLLIRYLQNHENHVKADYFNNNKL
ncbi:MAG: hypothetical protein MI974_31870 [Chitinophagales bacterium]|nr:hypothetical protein [Chitinophagales bacterium]